MNTNSAKSLFSKICLCGEGDDSATLMAGLGVNQSYVDRVCDVMLDAFSAVSGVFYGHQVKNVYLK